jgi:hypothetical protein
MRSRGKHEDNWLERELDAITATAKRVMNHAAEPDIIALGEALARLSLIVKGHIREED